MSTMPSPENQQRGLQCFLDGKLEDAVHLLGEDIAEGETSERWNDWAAVQLATQNVTGAEKALRRALKLEPQNLLTAANLGAVLASLGRTDEAIPLLERSWPGLATAEKAIVTNLLLQCRASAEGSAPGAAPSAADPWSQITKLLSTQTTAINSVALRLIAQEEALDGLTKSLARLASTAPFGRPLDAASQLMHRPSTSYAVTSAMAKGDSQQDLRLVERLLAAYQFAASEFDGFKNSMWRQFFDQRHQAAHGVFMAGQTELAAAILRNPGSSDLFWGFDNLSATTKQKTVQQGDRDMIMDHLVRLTEAIGARPLDNPMAYLFRGDSPTVLDATSADTTIQRIEAVLGCTLSFPNPYPEEVGVQTSRGIVSYRAIPALYQAWRIKQLLKGISRPRVLEIGAGLGRAAYYAWQFGIRDYTIIDIPMTSICSGYFLGRVLGEDAVSLAGENPPESDSRIKILPPSHFLSAQDHYDLILNADSFVEFGESTAQDYWNQIEARADQFLSINHESNAYTVRQFIEGSPR
ncbi:MAG: putative sugar O-methyltransferase, partial [Candidatus Acidiferrales bacterium]